MKRVFALLLTLIVIFTTFGCSPAIIDIPISNSTVIIKTPEASNVTEAPVVTVMPVVTPLPTLEIVPTQTPAIKPTATALPTVKPTEKPTSTPAATEETKTSAPTSSDGKKYIALTFDDGPSTRATGRILDALEKNHAKATFFVVGMSDPPNKDSESLKAKKYALMQRAVSLGCEIGNHTMEHKHLPRLSESEIRKQVEGVNEIVKDATGSATKLVRPPYGDKSQVVYDAVDYPLILWSIDTLDWDTRNADKTYDAVIDNARDGDIVLMHDLYATTADAAERIIPKLIREGFTLVTVSELFKIKGIKLEAGKYYRNAY